MSLGFSSNTHWAAGLVLLHTLVVHVSKFTVHLWIVVVHFHFHIAIGHSQFGFKMIFDCLDIFGFRLTFVCLDISADGH